MQLTLLGAALVLLIVWLFLRRRRDAAQSPAQKAPEDKGRSAYHAVSIKFDEGACEAAKAMGGRRFLANAAPRLPLPECDALECRCRFVHHADRRSGRDRRSPFAAAGYGGGTGSFEKERRGTSGRRKSDSLDEEDFRL
jgi:LPXTG-motif cell wall-anchored protein